MNNGYVIFYANSGSGSGSGFRRVSNYSNLITNLDSTHKVMPVELLLELKTVY